MDADDSSRPGEITEVLARLRADDPGASDELFRLFYGELHRLASAKMRSQPPGHTLQPTALVHEAYLRLMQASGASFNDRAHFLSAAARVMRSILVDFARRRGSLKRGGDRQRITLDENLHGGMPGPEGIVAIHEALEKLEQLDAQGARVVELRFFGGLTMEETACALGVAESTAYVAWQHARTWLYREISG